MPSDLIPLTFHKIMQSRVYTLFILSGLDKKFGIYADPKVGQSIQTILSEKPKIRPYTHDLVSSIFEGLNIKLLQTVIYDVQDAVYYARLFLEQTINEQKHILDIDSRPSDCLTLALMHDIPIFCKKDAFDKIIPLEE